MESWNRNAPGGYYDIDENNIYEKFRILFEVNGEVDLAFVDFCKGKSEELLGWFLNQDEFKFIGASALFFIDKKAAP